MWVAFAGVEGAERELVMVFLYCVDLVSFFVYGCTGCNCLILTFQVIMLSSCLGSE